MTLLCHPSSNGFQPMKRMFVSKRCETHRMMSFGITFMANMISDRERFIFSRI